MRYKRRRSFHREKGVFSHPAQVPGVIHRGKGKGQLSRGPKLITGLKKGVMTNKAIKLGYINKDETISDIPKSRMDDFARDLVREVGTGRAMKMVQVQINFRANQRDGFKDKMLIAKGAIRRQSKVLKVHPLKS